MDLRTFGASSLQVTPIGLGAAALGRPGYISLGHSADIASTDPDAMQQHMHSVLDAAWAAGIRHFDAARSYGRGEEFLGSWLRARDIPPAEVAVSSKWGYTYTADWQVDADVHEVKDHTLPVLQRQWRETQTHLGGYLDLYQIHSATLDSGVFDRPDVLTELARLKSAGTLIGLSLSGPGQGATLLRALETEVDGVRLFDGVQATWNLLEKAAEPALRAASAAGIGVMLKEVVANGRLTERGKADPNFTEQYALLRHHAERLATTIDALAMAAALAQPWVGIALSGAATSAHVESNVRALAVDWDDAAAEALASLVEPPERYWSTRKALPWN